MTISNLSKRRWAIRLLLIAALIGVAFWMYEIGKEHSVLIDNETVTIGGKEYQAIDRADVILDGNEDKKLSFEADDRLIQKMVGRSHTLRVKILGDDEETVIGTVERHIKININTQALMLSLPAIVEEAPEIFIPNPLFSPQEEEKPESSSTEGAGENATE